VKIVGHYSGMFSLLLSLLVYWVHWSGMLFSSHIRVHLKILLLLLLLLLSIWI